MKWYSVKEHQPILSICCVLLAVHVPDTGGIYLTLGEWDNGWKDWEEKFDIQKELNHRVLYFCYPDPIPKAYENLIEASTIKKNSDHVPLMDILIEDFCAGDKFEPGNYFSVRAVNCLKAEGIKTIGQLLSWCDHQLLKTQNFGRKSLNETKEVLAHKNLKIGMNSMYITKDGGRSKCQYCIHK